MATAIALDEPCGSKCRDFHRYNFEKDPQFMKGWETISHSHKDESVPLETRMLTAKVFYYARFVAPITLEEYQMWLADHGEEARGGNQAASSPGANVPAEAQNAGEKHADGEIPNPKVSDQEQALVDNIGLVANAEAAELQAPGQSAVSCAQKSASGDASQQEDPKYPSSFMEVMERVQAGLDIPGVEELHVEATNEPATEPSATVVKKPWET